jgi:hypothetical protein
MVLFKAANVFLKFVLERTPFFYTIPKLLIDPKLLPDETSEKY